MKLRDKLWLMGQSEGVDKLRMRNYIPGDNRMSQMEGAYYFGIKNLFSQIISGHPFAPFRQEAMVLDTLDNVIWSALGDPASGNTLHVNEIIALAKEHKNICGVLLQDLLSSERINLFSPKDIRNIKNQLKESGRELELWATITDAGDDAGLEIKEDRRKHIAELDGVLMWHFWNERLHLMEENVQKTKDLLSKNQKLYAAAYMWFYDHNKPAPADVMEFQLDTLYSLLKRGEIDGIAIHSNGCADLGFDSVRVTKEWIKKHADEEI